MSRRRAKQSPVSKCDYPKCDRPWRFSYAPRGKVPLKRCELHHFSREEIRHQEPCR